MVLKPSPLASLTCCALGELVAAAGAPAGSADGSFLAWGSLEPEPQAWRCFVDASCLGFRVSLAEDADETWGNCSVLVRSRSRCSVFFRDSGKPQLQNQRGSLSVAASGFRAYPKPLSAKTLKHQSPNPKALKPSNPKPRNP